jgi:hypothetical protein
MLPDFAKFRHELDGYTMLKLHAMVQQKEPILAEIRGITQHEGDVIAYDQLTSDGVKIVTEGFKESRVHFETKVEDVPTLNGTSLDTKLSGIAEDIARDLSGSLRGTLNTATREAGTFFDAGGSPLSKDHYLELLERMEINFDSKTGRPDLVFWAGQAMVETMQHDWDEWKQDRDFVRKYNDLLSRKREDWRDRESRRKLVD